MPKKSAAPKPAPKKKPVARPVSKKAPRPAKAELVRVTKPVRAAEPMQFEFGKLLDVVERQSSKAPAVVLKPDAATRAAIEAIVLKERELIRKAMRKLRKTPAWVRQQWAAVAGVSLQPLSEAFTPEQYADRVRLGDRTVPPPGPVRAKLLEAGRKLKG